MNKRELIMLTAFADFLEDGIEAVSISRITNEVGLAKSTFFNYFPNKDALIEAVFTEYYLNVNAKIVFDLYNAKGTWRQKIEEVFYSPIVVSEYITSQISKVRVPTVSVFGDFPREYYKLRGTTNHIYTNNNICKQTVLLDAITQGQEAGEIRADLEPEAAVLFILSAHSGIVQTATTFSKKVNFKRLVQTILKEVFAYLEA